MSSSRTTSKTYQTQLIQSSILSSKETGNLAPEVLLTSASSSRKSATLDISTPSLSSAAPFQLMSTPQLPFTNEDNMNTGKKRRFAPQPLETTTRNNRAQLSEQRTTEEMAPLLPHEQAMNTPQSIDTSKKPARRKFSPQLIETATRCRRAGDYYPAVQPSDKTNVSPSDPAIRPSATPCPPTNTPTTSLLQVPQLPRTSPQRQGSLYPHYNTRANTRQHSFKVPNLDPIESSDDSGPPSLSRSPTASSHSSETYAHATRMRESVDDRFSGYLLDLAARAAEKQLREQEASAYLNSDFQHQPVAHYMGHESSGDEGNESPVLKPRYARRDSAEEEAALRELQKHSERIKKEQQKTGSQPTRKKTNKFNVEFDGEITRQDAWITPEAPKQLIGGRQRDPVLKQMRKAASPPMLGGDIDFPRCPSPEHARFDVTQGSEYLRNNMCYLNSQAESSEGLWGLCKKPEARPSVQTETSNGSKSTAAGGLWGGLCNYKDVKPASEPSGMVTPMRTPVVEKDDPFLQLNTGAAVGTSITGKRDHPSTLSPLSPSCITSAPNTVMDKLEQEARLNDEYPDTFITQLYNYLSLGYPALARKFDDELSRISSVPVHELREDDKYAEARGYLSLGDDECTQEEEAIDAESCARWRALRLYVREWGRQMWTRELGMLGKKREDPHRAWGLPARRGSWGN